MRTTKKQKESFQNCLEINLTDLKIFLDFIIERQVQREIEDDTPIDGETVRWAVQAKKSLNDLEEIIELQGLQK